MMIALSNYKLKDYNNEKLIMIKKKFKKNY